MERSLLWDSRNVKEGRVQPATEEAPRAHRSLDRPARIGRISPGKAGRAASGKGQGLTIKEKEGLRPLGGLQRTKGKAAH